MLMARAARKLDPMQDSPDIESGGASSPSVAPGLIQLLAGSGGDLHAIESRLAEIANVLPAAIDAASGDTKSALEALAALI